MPLQHRRSAHAAPTMHHQPHGDCLRSSCQATAAMPNVRCTRPSLWAARRNQEGVSGAARFCGWAGLDRLRRLPASAKPGTPPHDAADAVPEDVKEEHSATSWSCSKPISLHRPGAGAQPHGCAGGGNGQIHARRAAAAWAILPQCTQVEWPRVHPRRIRDVAAGAMLQVHALPARWNMT